MGNIIGNVALMNIRRGTSFFGHYFEQYAQQKFFAYLQPLVCS